MSTPENGTYATRAELKAHLDPMKKDIGEIKADVKSLLLSQAGQSGEKIQRRLFSDRVLALGALLAAAGATVAGFLHG